MNLANAHLAVYVPHLRQGGGELSMLRLAHGLATGVALGSAADLAATAHAPGVTPRVTLLVNTLASAEVHAPPGLAVVSLGTSGTVGSLRALAQWLRAHQPQWLLSAFPHSNVAAVAARVWAGSATRCVVSEHAPLSLQIQAQGNWRYSVLPPLVRWAYRRADAVVAVSHGVRDDLQELAGPGLNLHVIANPVLDAGRARDTAVGTPLHPWLLDKSLAVVLSVSRLSREKDLPTLLRAFSMLYAQRPGTRLVMAGDGPERERLQALVHTLQLDSVVALPGRITAPRAWMQHARVFALASRYEGFGNTLVEALASGVAVVSTDCPVGPREILQAGRFGRLVPVGDAAAMAQALQQALDQPGPPPGAVQHAWQYTDAAACGAYLKLLHHLCPQAGLLASPALTDALTDTLPDGPTDTPAAPALQGPTAQGQAPC